MFIKSCPEGGLDKEDFNNIITASIEFDLTKKESLFIRIIKPNLNN